MKVEKVVVSVKTFGHYHHKFNFYLFFSCPAKLQKDLKLKFRSKFNHGFINLGYLHSAIWKTLYNFNVERAQEARDNQFIFQNVQSNETSKCSKTADKLMFTTQKVKAWSNCFGDSFLSLTKRKSYILQNLHFGNLKV